MDDQRHGEDNTRYYANTQENRTRGLDYFCTFYILHKFSWVAVVA